MPKPDNNIRKENSGKSHLTHECRFKNDKQNTSNLNQQYVKRITHHEQNKIIIWSLAINAEEAFDEI